MSDFNERVIAEFRANGGRVETAGFGDDLVLLHTTGAKSGEARVSPVVAIADGDAWLVLAAAGGAPRHPAWYFNLVAQPDVVVESGTDTVDVRASALDGTAYDRAWSRFTARSSAIEEYQQRAGDRTFPIVRLARR